MSQVSPQIGHRIDRYGVVTSTNDLAWERIADSANHGIVILAEEQTKGRGRRGGVWQAPAGSSLLVSIPLRPAPTLARPVLLTLWASLGVCRAIDQLFHLPVTWKWPNDVLVQGKKVCGTLVEQRGDAFVVGVGLNLTTPTPYFESEQLPNAAALAHFTTTPVERDVVLARLLAIWDESYQALAKGDISGLLRDWHDYSRLLNHTVELESGAQVCSGTINALTLDAVTLHVDGQARQFVPESITRLTRL